PPAFLQNSTDTILGLEALADLPRLSELVLHGGITDEGLRVVGSFPQLNTLTIWSDKVSADGWINLEPLQTLDRLTIHCCDLWHSRPVGEPYRLVTRPISDTSLISISHLRELKHLAISHAALSDRGLGSLARMTKLETLEVGQIKSIGEGLRRIIALPKLRRLTISSSVITDNVVAELKKNRPDIDIVCHHTIPESV
ncbi:MAG TPA: hypothetical protein VKU87_07915, partial [Thermomicrobiaceae bacterium]|nr:hypothetical protein [Thermomicrobiaceae bacterium]